MITGNNLPKMLIKLTRFTSKLTNRKLNILYCATGNDLLRNNRTFATISHQIDETQEVLVNRLSDQFSGITVVSLNRQKAKNSLSKSLVKSLEDAFANLNQDRTTRVVIFRSLVPRIFCAGADLKERLTMPESEVAPFVCRLRGLAQTLADLSSPTIAAIDGAALGGGLELALACDMRIATSSSKLGLVETKLAIIPGAGGTQRLPRLVGVSRAKELIFTGKILDGLQSEKIGLINEVVESAAPNSPPDSSPAYQRALTVASEIAANGPLALRAAKSAISLGIDCNLQQGMKHEEANYATVIPSKDRVEGLKAFNEKRPPKYVGQ